MKFNILQYESTTIFFDETIRESLVLLNQSSALKTNASQRNSQVIDNLVVSKPILNGGQIIINNQPIPTMSQWGLLIFGLLVLNLGIFGIFYKEEKFLNQ